ncbi:MAG: hypothetical protein VYD25_13930, partial [Pseudomonadota bacterium]|nr:hypothetical protein [Pseudomonadota bacterium]
WFLFLKNTNSVGEGNTGAGRYGPLDPPLFSHRQVPTNHEIQNDRSGQVALSYPSLPQAKGSPWPMLQLDDPEPASHVQSQLGVNRQ